MTLKANDVKYSGGRQYELLEAGNYPARVVQVIDLGLQAQRPYEGKEKRPAYEIMVTYELGTEFLKDEDGEIDESRPRWLSETFALYSLSSERAKSTLRYNALDPKGKYDGDWSELVGSPCLVAVVVTKNKHTNKEYNNVGGISLPIKGMVVPEIVNPEKMKTFDLSYPDLEVFESLPEWVREKIQGNLQYPGSVLAEMLAGEDPGVDEDEDVDEDLRGDEIPF